MRKRLLTCVLALAMATTLLPMSVFAATTDEGTTVPSNPLISATEVPSVSSEKDSKVQIEKTVNDDSSIELSAYVTGAVKTTSKPLDIVLVLDVSGSMGDPYAAPEYQATAKTTWSYNDIKNDKNNKYYFKSGKSYYPVYADTYGLFETNYVLCADGYGSWLDDSFSDSSRDPDAIIYHKSLYIMTSAQKNKIDALKTAVNGFIESVSADATENSVTHNISIVKFAGNKSDKVGNDTYRDGTFTYNYSQVVVPLTDVSNGKTKLTNAVQDLRPAGATRADYGLELAQAELAKSSEGHQKVVIMFTDGEPTETSMFSNQVASGAIKAAKGLKAGGTQVFTVGIFDKTPSSDMTNYMNAVSSNYLTASYDKGQGGGWNWNLGTQTSNNYYKDASALDLSAVFQQIQSEMASVEVKSTAVLSDTLSACFKLSTDASKAVTAEVQSISKDGKTWTGDTDQPTLTVETNGKDITVTGFDYGANPVINKGTAEAPDWTGKRVVLTIPFEPDTGYTGWVAGEKNYFTNDTDTNKAGLRDGSETYNELTKSPTAPVTGYTVTYDWTDLPEGVAATPNKPAQAVLIPGQTFTKDDTSYTAEGYTFSGWGEPEYDTNQTLQPTGGNYTMPTSDVTITGTWTPKEPVSTIGTLTIAKTINWAGSEEETAAVREAANGHTFTFQVMKGDEVVDTVDITYSKDFASGEEMKVNSKSIQLPVGTYTVVEVADTIDLVGKDVIYKGTPSYMWGQSWTIKANDILVCPVSNVYNETAPITTGTLSITKYVTDIHAQDQSEVQAAANGKIFSFTVTGANGSFLKNVVYSNQGSAKNSVEFTNLPAGEYTVTETNYPLVLGFNKDTNLFKWSYAGTSYAPYNTSDFSYGSTYTVTVTADATTKLVCFNRYDSWKDGIGKSATNLDSNYISNVTLTMTGQKFEHEAEISSASEISSAREKTTYTEYSIPEGAQVKDFMGYTTDYNFDLVDISKMTVAVTDLDEDTNEIKTNTYPAVALTGYPQPETGENWQYGFNEVGDGYFAYYVKYQKASDGTEHFVWMTRDPIEEGTTVQINYSVKLMNPKTASGTYGQFDPYGEYNYAELLTNNSAILYEEIKWEAEGGTVTTTENLIATFPQPTVSYKISNNGGGGGHSRPALNTEDHYGYIIGYPDGTVQPGGSITRAEVATIFFRMLTDSSRTEFWSQTNSFSDVPSTAWFNNAVSTLTKAGIIAGYEDGTFQPNATITRAEFATIAVRFFEASYDGKDFFTDIDGHWAQQYINDAANAGLVNGYEDGTFGPNKAITRAEAMTLVNRALDRHPDADHFLKDMITWPDNSDTTAWYYEAVQEATNSHEYTMKTNTDKTKYENWTKMLKMRDWKAFEAAWSDANSASNPGEVMGK